MIELYQWVMVFGMDGTQGSSDKIQNTKHNPEVQGRYSNFGFNI